MSDPIHIPGSSSGRTCPDCGSPTVWRVGRYGEFHGCSKFPQCRGKIGRPRGKYAPKAEQPETPESSPETPPSNPETPEVTVTPPAATPTPTLPASSPGLGDALWSALAPVLSAEIDRKIAAARNVAAKIEWVVNDKPFATAEGAYHHVLPEFLRRLKGAVKGEENFLLVGPAGTGKTHLAADVAKSVKARKFACVSCTAGMPEWHLMGRSTPNLTTGTNVYQPSEFVDIYENGGVFLLDEFDAADPNTVLVFNSALANGRMSLPHRTEKPVATRHPDCIVVAAANTFGLGADRMYAGRNQLDASTLSRFEILEVGYDEDLEDALVGDAKICARVRAIRERVAKVGLRKIVGTRELRRVAAKVKSGETLDYAIQCMVTGWTADEKSKAGVN